MRSLILAWLFVSMDAGIVQQAATSGTALIAGRVIAGDTLAPVKLARVTLSSGQGARLSRTTDDSGRYQFSALDAGRYKVVAVAEHYAATEYGQALAQPFGKPIDVRNGEQFSTADITLLRTSAVEGKVLDEFGDPVPNARVQLFREGYVAGVRRITAINTSTELRSTDDRGHFRISNVPPGVYLLAAVTGVFATQDEVGGFAPTYFPGTVDVDAARAITVRPGRDVADVSITLVPSRMVRVAGTVTDEAGQPGDAMVILIRSPENHVIESLAGQVLTDASGKFVFRNIPSGSFTIQALGRSPRGLNQAPFGWVPLAVNGSNIDNVAIRLTPGATVRGRISFDDVRVAAPAPSELVVFPKPVEFRASPVIGAGPPRNMIGADWTFEIDHMFGQRIVRVEARSPWSLKSVTVGGLDVTDKPLDFDKGDVDGVEIVLTTSSNTISGVVVDAAEAIVSDCFVVVFAADSSKWSYPSRFVQVVRPDQKGQFVVQGLPAEQYLIIAVPISQGAEGQEPSFLERVRPHGIQVTLSEAQSRTLQVRLADVR